MRVALCEDEKMYSEILVRMIRQWATGREEIIDIKVYESAEAFLADSERSAKIDIAFLDIHLGGMSGFELASIRRTISPRCRLTPAMTNTRNAHNL